MAPILVMRCLECHNERQAAGGLVLETQEAARRGGDSGDVIVPHDVDASYLMDRVEAGEMPPEKQGRPQPLAAEETEILRRWIAAGAAWPAGRRLDLFEQTTEVRAGRDWWSLQPIARPEVPRVAAAQQPGNPIDAFIRARLDEANLRPAPQADPRTLVRRLSFNVIGLPPTREQLERFAADPSEEAWEQLVDEMLASPHYGERWGRHWLDVVRFAETSGYERDQEKPYAWKYRDWVVDAFNNDMPFDRFVLEQVAGDELPDRDEQSVIATGFLRLGTWNDEPNEPLDYQYERLEDLVHATSSAFLGLTVKCARCHDHKFDPIPQQDYYRMAAAFWPGPIAPGSREHLGGPSPEALGYENVLGWTDVRTEPPPLHLLHNGERHHPGEVVEPTPLSFVEALLTSAEADSPSTQTTGHRLRLAHWIANPDNPLTARVIVNRLWQHHFGQGIVRSPNNFGFRGDRPTHPLLLDWLAAKLVDGGWSLKPLHKLILTSETWRQSSDHPRHDAYADIDAGNQLWWRAERRRLEAESLWDAMLAAAGELDLSIGGPSFRPTIAAEALEGLSRKGAAWTASPLDEQNRRSLYIYTQRSLLVPFLTTFDFADTTLPCAARDVTTVAPQALALLNNALVHRRSRELADRILAQETSGDLKRAAKLAWLYALGREPSEDELALARAHLEQQQTAFAQRLAANEKAGESLGTPSLPPGAVLHLTAEAGVETDHIGRVAGWGDQSPKGFDAVQAVAANRPQFKSTSKDGPSAIHFDGQARFLVLPSLELASEDVTIVAVVSDLASDGHREIFSNWDGAAGNSVTSLFLGLTGDGDVRFSDDFAPAGNVTARERPFVLAVVNGPHQAAVYLNGEALAHREAPLSPRRLDTQFVIGQQGNIGGEYWHGDLYELLIYDRPLSEPELAGVGQYLGERYSLAPPAPRSPEQLALESLCHVLFNSNEFVYVD